MEDIVSDNDTWGLGPCVVDVQKMLDALVESLAREENK